MSSPLDRIEEKLAWDERSLLQIERDDVLALVNVAKAAEDIERRVVDGPDFDLGEIFNSAGRLAKALAALNKEPA